jgi:two-component system, sensor histidine kinase
MPLIGPSTSDQKRKLPWWTWIAGFAILHLGSYISVQFKIEHGISAIYLPTAFGIVLVNWWGPTRVLPLVYLSAVLGSPAWGVEDLHNWFLFSLPETLMVFVSWFLFTAKAQGKYWLPDIKSLLLFLVLGIVIPIIPELLSLQGLFVVSGQNPPEKFWFDFIRNCLGEFTSSFGISLILLYYFSPLMDRAGLTLYHNNIYIKRIGLTHWQWAEVIVIASLLLISVFTIEFKKYWFFYGVFSLFTAIRGGFGIAILVNFYIYLITYIFPSIFPWYGHIDLKTDKDTVYIFLGISMLYVFAAVTGRIFNDLIGVERKLRGQYKELETANAELDQFVYSVSHDLSAPLKSIQGLVNIGRVDVTDPNSKQYFTKIESSVRKMEAFIGEVLDYSRSKRLDVHFELIGLKGLIYEIWNNLKDTEGFDRISLDVSGIAQPTIVSDRPRVKIILNNLLSNAIKYQTTIPGQQPVITVSSVKQNGTVVVAVEDNGEGIHPDLMPKIFNMFYRGNEKSKGSGLGLYIAKEAAEKIKASLKVRSIFGVGTTFTLTFK